jgi:Protein of unknown function (DUF4240)
MTEHDFWQLIARSQRGQTFAQAQELRRLLEPLDAAEVLSFAEHYIKVFGEAYTNKLWGAMYLLFGGCGDDGFMDARAGLIAHGEKTFREALRNPDVLADLEDPEGQLLQGSAIQSVAQKVYESKNEAGLPDLWKLLPDKPSGSFPDEDEMPELYPKLWERFGDDL